LGKDGNAYLVNRNNLGGVAAPVAELPVDGVTRGQSSATYHTNQGTYFVFRTGSGGISAYKIAAANPPAIAPAWNVSQSGQGSPWVTTTDGTNNAIVWVVGAQGGHRLHGYNGDTGAVVYAGGGADELMTGDRKWNSGIVARGSIYVANDNKVYKFNVPGGAPTPTPSPGVSPTPTPTPTATPGCYTDAGNDTYTYRYADDYSLAKCEPNLYSKGNAQASPDAATASDSPASAIDSEFPVIRDW
jgi:hypothetical protein